MQNKETEMFIDKLFKKKEKIETDVIKAKDIEATAVKVNGNFMIGDFTCNFVWSDDLNAYVLCGWKE